MYPSTNESEIYPTQSNTGYVPPTAPSSYGTPPPPPPSYGTAQPPPYTYIAPYVNTSIRAPVRSHTEQWTTGFCHCLDDPGNCLVTCFCPCVTFGLIAEIIDKGTSTCTCTGAIYGTLLALTGHACLYSCYYRSKLRAQYNLPEEPCMDFLAHYCCEVCALCQVYRELKNRGFDLSIGWEANQERQRPVQGVIVTPPVISQAMTR